MKNKLNWFKLPQKLSDIFKTGSKGEFLVTGKDGDLESRKFQADDWSDGAPREGDWVAALSYEYPDDPIKMGFLELNYKEPKGNTIAFRDPATATIKAGEAVDDDDLVTLGQLKLILEEYQKKV